MNTRNPQPDEETGPESLHPNILLFWIGAVVIGALLIGGVVAGATMYAPVPLWGAPVVGAAVLIAGVVYAVLRYRAWSFEIQEDGIYLTRGVIIQVKTLVPYVRLQHVDTQRGPIDRLLGLSSTVMYTAGTRGADVLIPGLDHERAEQLQRELRDLILDEDARLGDAV